MKTFLYRYRFYFLLGIIAALVFATNYVQGTYLIGWDSLQTELAPLLSVKRALSAVWVYYQSFGFTSGMGDAADLVRSVVVLFMSLILPNNLVRYTFHTLMLLAGAVGVFKLLKRTGLAKKNELFAFAGAVFYMLNFGTVQIFYVPFEPYSLFFGLLPWELLAYLDLLDAKRVSRRLFALFVLVNILAVSQAYLQTFFVVYALVLVFFTSGYIISRKSFPWHNILLAAATILVLNAFWLMPQMYFLKTSRAVVTEAKINQIATEDVYYQNREKGVPSAFIKFEGFYFDLFGNDKNGSIPLFLPWKKHFENPVAAASAYVIFAVCIAGLLSGARKKYHFSFAAIYALVALMLLSNTPPLKQLNDLIRGQPFINQIFRSPFTKFIIPYALVSGYFFSLGLAFLAESLARVKKRLAFLALIPVALFLLYSFPVFQGNFFSPTVKRAIPPRYLEMIGYFNRQDLHKRIAILPEPSFWGWYFHSWQYDGSGFLWWGIQQPIISRTFDVWSPKSESYYWEIKTAMDTENRQLFNAVLEKYDVDYLVVDPSIMPTATSIKGLQFDRIPLFLDGNGKIYPIRSFGDIRLYGVRHDKPIKSFTSVSTALPDIGPDVKLMTFDAPYAEYGDYKTTPGGYDYYQPFLGMQTVSRFAGQDWHIKNADNAFALIKTLDFNTDSYNLFVATSSSRTFAVFGEDIRYYENKYTISSEGNDLVYSIPEQLISSVPLQSEVRNCTSPLGKTESRMEGSSLFIRSTGKSTGCFGYILPYLPQKFGYLVRITSQNTEGRHLSFYMLDSTKKQLVLQDELRGKDDLFIIPPNYSYGMGYEITFNNKSYDGIPAANRLDSIEVYSFPYEEINALQFAKNTPPPAPPVYSQKYEAMSPNSFTYRVTGLENGLNRDITLHQQYDKGWNMYAIDPKNPAQAILPFLGTPVSDHFKVNNWANGWTVRQAQADKTYVMLFLPQYLEYAGFAMPVIFLLLMIPLLKTKHEKSK